ncbi:hypothetical protein JXJ21_06185 [candidate division KSB1 bacterium]|nr:hypothetical protein [candidate division KSB1 bacterium]
MRRINVLFRLVTGLIVFGANCHISGQSGAAKPEKVYRIVYEIEPNDWYKQQADLWKTEIEKNPANPEAWYNYYNANRYAHFEDISSAEKKRKLNEIIEKMAQAIPDTYEFYLLKYWTTYDLFDLALIEKAYAIDPDRPDTYYPFISHYEIHGQEDKVREFCQKLYQSRDIAPWLINYNYNVLQSTGPNAILFTNGDNDTYPAWLLQHVQGVRSDVTIINISLAAVESYLPHKLKKRNIILDYKELRQDAFIIQNGQKSGFSPQRFAQALGKAIADTYPDIPLYFSFTVTHEVIDFFKDNLYITGLAYRYIKKRIDNLALLQKNFEHEFRLNYLTFDWYDDAFPGEKLRNQTHLNYVPPMIMLLEHYQLSGETEKARYWKELALLLAERSGNKQLIDELKHK